MKKRKISNNAEIFKVSNKLKGKNYFTFLTMEVVNSTKKLVKNDRYIYSPNNQYLFTIGNKINKNTLESCVVSVQLENYSIVEAQIFPERPRFNISLKRDEEELKKISMNMIENNPQRYGVFQEIANKYFSKQNEEFYEEHNDTINDDMSM